MPLGKRQARRKRWGSGASQGIRVAHQLRPHESSETIDRAFVFCGRTERGEILVNYRSHESASEKDGKVSGVGARDKTATQANPINEMRTPKEI
jgi:hypothetical protein